MIYKFISVACLFLVVVCSIVKASVPDADKKFKNQLYEEAAQIYEKQLLIENANSLTAEDKEEIQLKWCQALVLSGKYEKALTQIDKMKVKSASRNYPFFLLAKAKIFQNYLNNYRYQMESNDIEGETSVLKKTPVYFENAIAELAQLLWDQRLNYKTVYINENLYLFDLNNADVEKLPTFYDYLAYQFQNDYQWQRVKGFQMRQLLLEASQLDSDAKLLKTRAFAREKWLIDMKVIDFKVSRYPEYDFTYKISESKKQSVANADEILSFIKELKTARAQAEWYVIMAITELKNKNFTSSYAHCDKALDLYKSQETSECLSIQRMILNKEIAFEHGSFNSQQEIELPLKIRNLEKIFIRLYEVPFTSWENFFQEFKSTNINYLDRTQIQSWLLKKPIYESSLVVKPIVKYSSSNEVIKLLKRPPGRYILIASENNNFEYEKTFMAGTYLQVSDLVMLTQIGIDFNPEKSLAVKEVKFLPSHHFYYFNSINGKLEKGVTLKHSLNYKVTQELTEQNEHTVIKDEWDFSGKNRTGYGFQMDSLAIKGKSFSYIKQYVNKPHQQKIHVIIEKDRPIYRPGQKINLKVMAFRRVPFGWEVLPQKTVTLSIKDANYKAINTQELKLTEMGSASHVFLIPKNALLGNYYIEANINDLEFDSLNIRKNFSDSFLVEEYKRPDFYVELPKINSGSWVFNQPVKIKLSAKYYHGSPVKKGNVSYTINRQVYRPWFYSRYFEDVNSSSGDTGKDSVSGQGITDENGDLLIDFVPVSSSEVPLRYTVNVSVRDSGGRTISEKQDFFASKSEFLIQVVGDRNFYLSSDKPRFLIEFKDLNEIKYSGDLEWTLSELLPPTKEQIQKLKENVGSIGSYSSYRHSYRYQPEKDLVYYLKDLDKKEIFKRNIKISKDKPDSVELPKANEGFYFLKLRGQDSKGVKVEAESYLIVYDNGDKLSEYYIPQLTLVEKKSYKVNEKIKILFGSSLLRADTVINLLKNQFLITSKTFTDHKKFRFMEIKSEETFQRGISFNWFGYGEDKVIQDAEVIDVEPYKKKLQLELSFKKEIKPGDKQQIKFKIEEGEESSEGMVKVYDQSLEYYNKEDRDRFFEFYNIDESSQIANSFIFYPQTAIVTEKTNLFVEMLKLFRKNMKQKYPPRLYMEFSHSGFRRGMKGGEVELLSDFGAGEVATAGAARNTMPTLSAQAPEESFAENKVKISGKGAADKESRVVADSKQANESNSAKFSFADFDKVKIRSDFSETAVFDPFIRFKGGKAQSEFLLPEQLTSWKVKALVFSKNGKISESSGSFIANKSLMTKLQIPRFFREKDISEIKVFVENKSLRDLSGTVKLSLEQNGKNVFSEFATVSDIQKWQLKPGGQSSLSWKVQIPSQLRDLKIRAVGIAGAESDAEERTIPILPSRERLIETQMAFLTEKGKTKLNLPNWGNKDETRINELISVQIEPQLPLLLLNSLPSLINYPHGCSEQLINKYVPLAILTSLYQKNPKLKEALAKVPTRKTINLPWEDNDPRRMISLMETPWKQISEGLQSPYELISLLDAQQVEKIKSYIFEELQRRQLPSGGFSWFSGGREDLYITLILLEGFAEAAKYGVEIPSSLVTKALDYIYGELPKYLKAEVPELQFLIYGSYIFSSFDTSKLKLSRNKEAIGTWLPFIEKRERLITPLGHAYMANIYFRLGQIDKSNNSLRRAFDGMKSDKLIGAYWAPEEKSWIWYHDTTEKHAFFIQTLVEIKPQDERIKELVKWLLFNRKGNEWKSTRTSAKAIYAILGFMKAGGALDKPTQVEMIWGDLAKKINIDPYDFPKEPIRFNKNDNFKIGDGGVEFKKSGGVPVIASSTWIYTTDKLSTGSTSSVLALERQFYLVKNNLNKPTLALLNSDSKINVGDEVEVQLKIKAKSQLEYLHLKDPRGAGFEANQLLSGYVWDMLSRYEEPRDSLTNFFIAWLPQGEYILKHRFRATTQGKYKFGSAVIQSMYSPDMSAYSSGMMLEVK